MGRRKKGVWNEDAQDGGGVRGREDESERGK